MYNVTVPTNLNKTYTIVEASCAIIATFENFLVILVFARSRRLRKITNYYVISLAVADLLVGLIGIPSAISTSVGLPTNFHLCIFMHSILLLLCTGSILSLLSITVDRYWAIIHPLSYNCHVTEERALRVVIGCWIGASFLGLLPTIGWNQGRPPEPRCFFMEVMDFRYLVFIYFVTMVGPSIFMAAVYAIIYGVVRKQISQMNDQMHSSSRALTSSESSSALHHQHRAAEARAARNFAIIVLFFIVSWFPLYTINTIKCFCPDCYVPQSVIDCCIVLSHLNSVWNPALYAWGMTDFREALIALIVSIKERLKIRNKEGMRESEVPMNGFRKTDATIAAVKVNFIIDED